MVGYLDQKVECDSVICFEDGNKVEIKFGYSEKAIKFEKIFH